MEDFWKWLERLEGKEISKNFSKTMLIGYMIRYLGYRFQGLWIIQSENKLYVKIGYIENNNMIETPTFDTKYKALEYVINKVRSLY